MSNEAPKAKLKRAKSSDAKRGAAVRVHTNTSTMAAAASVDPDKPLTEQQRLFAMFWAQGDSVPNAMARAGYSTAQYSYGYRMQKMPNVLALYHEEKRRYEEAAQMTRKKVMDMLLEAYDAAKLTSEPASMVSAAREIGKMCGYFTVQHKVEVSVSGNVLIDRMDRLSDEELLKIIEQGVPGAHEAPAPYLPLPDAE